MTKEKAQEVYKRLFDNIAKVIKGKNDVIELFLAAFFSGGHVLIEDIPGTGKTTLAKVLAKSIKCDFKRVQFTPDLLPTDIIGVSVYNQKDGSFNFNRGPIFTNVLLADEINRASPRTQSALLESMGEGQVSADGVRMELDKLFFVVATQNPVESHGTYPLPEAQMDRFMIKLSLGYTTPEEEAEILINQQIVHPFEKIDAVISKDEVLELMKYVREIKISEELVYYIVNLMIGTRNGENIQMGAGPRASIALMKMAQGIALTQGFDFVIPEHIQRGALPVMGHRIVMDNQAKFSGITADRIVKRIIEKTKVPV